MVLALGSEKYLHFSTQEAIVKNFTHKREKLHDRSADITDAAMYVLKLTDEAVTDFKNGFSEITIYQDNSPCSCSLFTLMSWIVQELQAKGVSACFSDPCFEVEKKGKSVVVRQFSLLRLNLTLHS